MLSSWDTTGDRPLPTWRYKSWQNLHDRNRRLDRAARNAYAAAKGRSAETPHPEVHKEIREGIEEALTVDFGAEEAKDAPAD